MIENDKLIDKKESKSYLEFLTELQILTENNISFILNKKINYPHCKKYEYELFEIQKIINGFDFMKAKKDDH